MDRAFRLRLFGGAAAVLAAQAAAIGVYRCVESGRNHARVQAVHYERLPARSAPDVTLVGADGTELRLAQLQGTPVLLHFWATWCPPCKAELPALLELARDLREDGGPRVIALSVDTDWDTLQTFFGGHVPPEVMRETHGTATQDYGVSTLPDTYLLSADGSLRIRLSGARDWSDERLEELLRAQSVTPR